MNSLIALLVLLLLVALSSLIGLVLRRTQTRVRHSSSADVASSTKITPQMLADSDVTPPRFGDRATIVQFSTEYCARCPATARVLAAQAQDQDDVEHIEVDVTNRDELIRRFNVLRTPTVLLLDDTGLVRSRVSGPITTAQARELLGSL